MTTVRRPGPSGGGAGERSVFTVSSVVPPALWDEFDAWYREEHLPSAARLLGARAAFRLEDPRAEARHTAAYLLEGGLTVEDIVDGEIGRSLKAEFDERWGDRVRRTWQVFSVIDAWRADP